MNTDSSRALPESAAADGLQGIQRHWAVIGILLGTFLGNLDPALHVHVFPRFADEPSDLRTRPVWFYDWARAPAFDLARDAPLMQNIRDRLEKAGVVPK